MGEHRYYFHLLSNLYRQILSEPTSISTIDTGELLNHLLNILHTKVVSQDIGEPKSYGWFIVKHNYYWMIIPYNMLWLTLPNTVYV